MTMVRGFLARVCVGAVLAAMPAVAHAQELLSIAAVVNDEIISGYDLDQSIRLFMTTTRLTDTPANRRRLRSQVLNKLIEERLQFQEAKRLKTAVNEEDMDRGLRVLERQNNMRPGDLKNFLASKNVDFEVFRTQLRSEIAWNKLVLRRLQPTISIGEEEIDDAMRRIEEDVTGGAYLLSEIFLPFDSQDQENDAIELARRVLGHLKDGAQFADLARQYSQGVTAYTGGDVGWIQPSQMPPPVSQALSTLKRRQVSEPIRTDAGYYLILVRDTRAFDGEGADDKAQLDLKQIVVPIAETASASEREAKRREAETISAKVNGCATADELAKPLNSLTSGDLGTIALTDLPGEIRSAVATLAIGRGSAPVARPGGIHVFVVCRRDELKAALPTRDDIARSLTNTRLALMARRYLRDLRRDAVIEIR
ncbi:MAG: hypothetical protein FJX61_07330 [Alphaproteobacteria bacterium]|nr:hypothetical protein [Alphaproteobacteria bacterium]